jgi:hypothetical protein
MKQDMSDMKHDITDMKHTISGLVQNVDILSKQVGQLLSKLSSAPPSLLVPAFDPTSSATQSETSPVGPVPENLPVLPPTPVIPESHPCVWNGTISKVKAAAYRSPSPLTTDPMVTVVLKPTTAPSTKVSDPPPRPKVSYAHIGTSPPLRAYQRRSTTSPQLVHPVSCVAEGEPAYRSRRLPNGSRNSPPINAVAPPTSHFPSDPLRSGGGESYSVRQDPRPSSGSGEVF